MEFDKYVAGDWVDEEKSHFCPNSNDEPNKCTEMKKKLEFLTRQSNKTRLRARSNCWSNLDLSFTVFPNDVILGCLSALSRLAALWTVFLAQCFNVVGFENDPLLSRDLLLLWPPGGWPWLPHRGRFGQQKHRTKRCVWVREVCAWVKERVSVNHGNPEWHKMAILKFFWFSQRSYCLPQKRLHRMICKPNPSQGFAS